MGFQNVYHWNMYQFHPAKYILDSAPPEKDIDVLFIGNVNPEIQKERSHYVYRLLKLKEHYNIQVKTGVYGAEYTELMRRAKIVFNKSIRSEANIRVFESLACDNLILYEDNNNEIGHYFEDGVDCVLYNTDNFEKKIIHYLTHDDERKEIIEKAKVKKSMFNFPRSLDKLADQLKALLNTYKKEDRRFNKLTQAEADYCNLLNFFNCTNYGTMIEHHHQYVIGSIKDPLKNCSSFTFHYVKLLRGESRSLELPVDEIFDTLQKSESGKVWNYFNYLQILKMQENTPREKELLKEYILYLRTPSNVNTNSVQGSPNLSMGEAYITDLHMNSYEDTLEPLRRILLSIHLYRLAEIELRDSNLQSSIDLFKESAETWSNHAHPLIFLGQLYSKFDPNLALQYLNDAFKINPFNSKVWYYKLETLRNLDKPIEQQQFLADIGFLKEISEKIYQNLFESMDEYF